MVDTLDRLKLDLVSEYERLGRVDIADWVRRHPAHRDELLDFWMFLSGTPRSSEPLEPDPLPPLDRSEAEIYERTLKDSCLAVTFGPSWLSPSADPQREALAADLESLRRTPRAARKQHLAFPKAVVCTWVVARLQRTRRRVSRLATQKVSYILEHAMNLGVFVEHDRKALGPYDHKARYRDAEPIARKKGWLTISGSTLTAASDLSDVTDYVGAYLRSEELAGRLLDCLAPLSDDELETIATVHWIARELEETGRPNTTEEIARALAATAEWKTKLSRSNFTESKLRAALLFLSDLRLASAEG